MSSIYIKQPYQDQCIMSLEEVNNLLLAGKISTSSIVWKPGMPEWIPILKMEGITNSPPPLPVSSGSSTPNLSHGEVLHKSPNPPMEERTAINETTKVSKKAILAFFLVLFGILTSTAGIGLILIVSGVVVGIRASREIKNSNGTRKGSGWLTAARVIFFIYIAMLGIGLLMIAVPSCSKVIKQQNSEPNSSSDISNGKHIQKVTGSKLAYSYSVPSNWTIKSDNKLFDSIATSDGVMVGVITQSSQYNDIQDVYKELLSKAKLKGAYDISEPQKIVKDGQEWLFFSFLTKENGVSALWSTYIYTGDYGTIRFSYNSKNAPFTDDQITFQHIFDSFKFPK